MRTTASGRPYFIDRRTRRTTWVDPRLPRPSDLPPGWDMALDKDGMPYYIDHVHRTTQRTKPVQPDACIVELPPSSGRHHKRSESVGSSGSWESLASLLSSVSSISISSVQSTFNSARAFIVGDTWSKDDTPSLTRMFWNRLRLNPTDASSTLSA